jgi:uncharacterized membrane protein (DUF373 family)
MTTNEDIPIGRLVSTIVSVLAFTLVLSLAGLVALGLVHGAESVQETLTHIIETVLGVFIGIAAGRLTSSE